MSTKKLAVGVSSCLLGQAVRFDGGHKRSRYLTDVLEPYVEWVPICPELEIGLGVPRETLQLRRGDSGPRLLTNKSERDLTDTMNDYSRERVERLRALNLRGYVLKKDSPSCGLERVRIYDENKVPAKDGVGLYAAVLAELLPELPLEEEGRLNDARLRENFITRLFAYDRWLRFRADGPGPGDLVRFHTEHKMQLLAHAPGIYRLMGPLVAEAGSRAEFEALLDEYGRLFLRTLQRVASPGRHVNTLQHLAGFLKDSIDPSAKEELHALIEDYRRGVVPLVAALSLLGHHLRERGHPWVEAQSYLDPYPRELGLRSAI